MGNNSSLDKRYSVKTFGCKVNTYDSALIQKSLDEKFRKFFFEEVEDRQVMSAGHDGGAVSGKEPRRYSSPQGAVSGKEPRCYSSTQGTVSGKEPRRYSPPRSGVHIVNTCAVTEEAVKEAQRWIRSYRRKHPDSCIVVTGCAAQVETERFSALEEVDLVIGNSHKSQLADIVTGAFYADENEMNRRDPLSPSFGDESDLAVRKRTFQSSIFKKNSLGKHGGLENGHSRLFLKIQDGCDSFCTFCIIPFARGKSRSIPPADLVHSVQKHYEQGVREVVLTGVHIGDYRAPDDTSKGLAALVNILLEKTTMPRIRLSSLEPVELSDELLDIFTSPRVCPHFHLSIQSTNSEVLSRMKRHYTAVDVENSFVKINKKFPDAFVGMDLIAGFAGETQAQFEDTYMRLKSWPWTKMHVFPYSPRRYTYAERAYPSWPRSVIMKRAALLRHLSEDRLKTERRKQIGTVKSVLALKNKDQLGISRDYWTVFRTPSAAATVRRTDVLTNKEDWQNYQSKGEAMSTSSDSAATTVRREDVLTNKEDWKNYQSKGEMMSISSDKEYCVRVDSVDEEKGYLRGVLV